MIVHGTIQQKPEPGAVSHAGLAIDQVQAEADTYDHARAKIDDLVPGGWRLIAVRRG